MANFKVLAFFSSMFLTFMQLNNAVPFHGLKDEIYAGKYKLLFTLLCMSVLERPLRMMARFY